MNLERIKAAVKAGLTVHWANAGYTVHTDKFDQWFVTWDKGGRRENSVGLFYGSPMDAIRKWDSVTYQSHKAREGKLIEDEKAFYVSWKDLSYLVDDAGNGDPVTADFKDNGRPLRYVKITTDDDRSWWVAVGSYLPNTLVDSSEAGDLAIEWIMERHRIIPEGRHEAKAGVTII